KGLLCEIPISDPKLWWPAGFGAQPLYNVEVNLKRDDDCLDHWQKRIGLRTLCICRDKDPDGSGESFCHMVNGIKIFAMGADYIPEDNLLPRRSQERTRRLLEDARLANMNTIRVWGGGCYPDDWFYDICDELGLLVWQDCMFACAAYDLSDEFEQNIRAEITDNVRRLRHHPSLALWCGNNEMEDFVLQGVWITEKKQSADYIKIFEYIIPGIVKREDPDAFYWPSSPSSGGSFESPNAPDRGDVHYWDVWHGLKPFTEYRKFLFRYASEFGFQSFPCMATIESFTEPEDRNPFSYVMEKHQRNASANGRIAEYLSQTYLYPTSFDAFVYASQLLQAQAMQYGVEHWRRHRGYCMGAIIWQLNDCWPVVSWSSIDYYGRWKALHSYEKRFFSPVLISCHEEGIISQNTNTNAEHLPEKMTARLNVSNETLDPFMGIARWSLRRPDGSVIESGSFNVNVPALSAEWLSEAQDFSKYSFYECYYAYELEDQAGNVIGSGSVLFCPPKHFPFADPCLKAVLCDDEIVVTAEAYARSVEIQCGPDVLLDDNFFDMNAGEKRIKILRGTPEFIKVRSVYDIK
ncbi:MAG: glycoside hydrolase family 2 protein, partial [Anaerolineaceae bacterium]|nr:glycoside hydrolase family 2 protein [Anaerolineaceae bacterium]